jgi:hypothetical protein
MLPPFGLQPPQEKRIFGVEAEYHKGLGALIPFSPFRLFAFSPIIL